MVNGDEGRLSELEYCLLASDNLDRYFSYSASGQFSTIRYALALANSFDNMGGKDQYMFIGGIGVLGNVLRHSDETCVQTFREVHDLDVVLRSRPYGYITDAFFDRLNTKKSSLSFPDKLVFLGSCSDINENELPELGIDVYIPHGNPRMGATVNGVNFDYYQWESRKTAELFGIPFNVANPLTLLNLKLDITTGKKSLRRVKDCQDIVNLVGVLERDSCPPIEIYTGLTDSQRSKLKEVFSENCQLCEGCGIRNCKQLIKPSAVYIKSIFKLEEEKPQNDEIIIAD